ncbi:hypothetical protein V6N12_071000 [Hibiscus sabdariffa]|uniref:NAC domain-containing protein n=1 Tax=Hibiscus sabdariffa TaxID=183260 RepID=A0ABR2FIS0_9ROSI
MLAVEQLLTELAGEEVNEQGLPPGFRFHPTDEELVTFYLASKVFNGNFCGLQIAEVDLNRCEPWELPEMSPSGLPLLVSTNLIVFAPLDRMLRNMLAALALQPQHNLLGSLCLLVERWFVSLLGLRYVHHGCNAADRRSRALAKEFRRGENGGEGVVLLQPEGQEIPERAENKQSHGSRILESHRQR